MADAPGMCIGEDERLGKALHDADSARDTRPAPAGAGTRSERDVVVGLVVGLVVGEGPAVEGEMVVEAEDLLGGVEIHVEEHGSRLAFGPGVGGAEGGVSEVERAEERVDGGGERGGGGEGRCSLQLVEGAGGEVHEVGSVASASRTRWRISVSTVFFLQRAASRRAWVARRSMSRRAPSACSWSFATASRENSSLSQPARRRRGGRERAVTSRGSGAGPKGPGMGADIWACLR